MNDYKIMVMKMVPRCATVFIVLFFVMLFLTNPVLGAEQFTRIGQWNHGEWILGKVQEIAIDNDGDLVGGFASMEKSKLVITPKNATVFAPLGQGPSDLMNLRAIFPYKGDMAIVEMPDKVKIFTKKDGTYVWKANKWFVQNRNVQFIADGLFINNRWFFAGKGLVFSGKPRMLKKTDKYRYFYIRVYDDEGKPIKTFLNGEMAAYSYSNFMNYFLDHYKNRLYFIRENELKVAIICPKELKEIGRQSLTTPSFYKKMPVEFYCDPDKQTYDMSQLKLEHHRWQTEYSRVEKMLVEGDYLVLQIRTCSSDLKKFALLFYDAGDFSLQKTIFTDDLLLAAKNGKYYFFAGGNPSLDDDVDDCIVNIYAFKDK